MHGVRLLLTRLGTLGHRFTPMIPAFGRLCFIPPTRGQAKTDFRADGSGHGMDRPCRVSQITTGVGGFAYRPEACTEYRWIACLRCCGPYPNQAANAVQRQCSTARKQSNGHGRVAALPFRAWADCRSGSCVPSGCRVPTLQSRSPAWVTTEAHRTLIHFDD